jgi:hypothetical protein
MHANVSAAFHLEDVVLVLGCIGKLNSLIMKMKDFLLSFEASFALHVYGNFIFLKYHNNVSQVYNSTYVEKQKCI